MNISEYVPAGERLRILLKGESGSGKSIQAASFPNVYFFDFDNRIRSVINYFRDKGKTDIDLDYYPLNKLEDAVNKLKGWRQTGCPYETIVLDTTTTLIASVLNYINEQKGNAGASKGKEGFGMSIELGFIKATALDDYKFLLSAIKQIIDHTKNIRDTHIILNGHITMKYKTTPAGDMIPMRMILAPGATAEEIPIHFDEIYHMDVEAPINKTQGRAKRVIKTESDSMDFARTAYKLPRELDVTDKLLYQQLCEYIPGLAGERKVVKPSNVRSI